jgi:hypothetical protein
MLLKNFRRLVVIILLLVLTGRPASSQNGETSTLSVRLAMSPDISIREQHINQTILRSLVLRARQFPDVAPCDLHDLFQIDFAFGEFGLGVRHENSAMRVKCLRAVVRYLLREDVAESDFIAARTFEARILRELYELNPKNPMGTNTAAQRLALLKIYRKHSPLHQMHSVDADAVAAVSFDEFNDWLKRNRKSGRVVFYGSRRLLEELELPVPDPMVIELVPSLASPRMPGGVLAFDGEDVGVPGLIALFLGKQGSSIIDDKVKRRFACNRQERPNLGDGYAAIARSSCLTSDEFGDVWLTLALRKAEGTSCSEFCRQVIELSRDDDIATTARFSPDGSNGLYVLLPPACNPPE